MALQSDHEFLPAEVARAVFPTAFRGYDQEAVRRYLTRLAESLEHQLDLRGLEALAAHAPNQDRIEELEAEVVELQEQIGSLESDLAEAASSEPPALDEQQAIAWLGEETARVLETARSAAADIMAKAETEAASMRSEAASELDSAREQADALRSEAEAEATARVATLTADAEERAANLIADAEQRSARLTSKAEERAAKVTTQAESAAAALTERAETQAQEATETAEALAQEVTETAEALAQEVTDAAEAEAQAKSAQAESALQQAQSTADAIEAKARAQADQMLSLAEERRRLLIAGFVQERRHSQQGLDRLTTARATLTAALRDANEQLDALVADLNDAESGSVVHDIGVGDGVTDSARSNTGNSGDAALGSSAEAEVEQLLAALDQELPEVPEPLVAPSPEATVGNPNRVRSVDEEKVEEARQATDEPAAVVAAAELSDKGTGGRGKRTTASPSKKKTPAKKSTKRASAKKSSAGRADTAKLANKPGTPDTAVTAKPKKSPSGQGSADGDLHEEQVDQAPDQPVAEDSSDQVASLVEGFTTIDVLTELQPEGPSATTVDADRGLVFADVAALPTAPLADIDAALLVPLVTVAEDPAERIITVEARAGRGQPDGRRGDFPLENPSVERLPSLFAARDAALARGGPNVRRHIRRALNDDQSDVMDRLRNGRGPITVDDLPPAAEQLDRFLGPVRRALTDVVKAGAQAGGREEVADPVVANLCRQIAAHLVDRLRLPTITILAEADHDDRELILEPIRSLYRDMRNIQMPDLADDALHEAFAIGLYEAIEPGSGIRWEVDPRTDPDPVCDINRNRDDLTKGEVFPSGHLRPLSLPGCRCLVVSDKRVDEA